jgi:plastocyanin
MTVRFKHILLATLLTIALAGLATAAEHDVEQQGLTFVPADLTIEVGDTVNWMWTSGSHTVTNGADLDDPDLGTLFDAPLNADNATFSYTFDEEGVFPYLCRPHASLDMVGTITVESGVAAEATTWHGVKALFR